MDVAEDFKLTEAGLIPESWQACEIEKLCKYRNGKALERYFNQSDGYTVISIGNYSSRGKFVPTETYISRAYSHELGSYVLRKDDLAVLLNDKTSVGTIIGRAILVDEDNKYIFNQRTIRLRPHDSVSSDYIFYQINGPDTHARIVGLAKPGTQIYINTGDILGLPIPLPRTKVEQEAIAEALSDADALVEYLEQLIAKKRRIKQGAMQEVLTGRRRLLGLEAKPDYEQTEVGLIPEDWEVKTLASVCSMKSGEGITSFSIDSFSKYPCFGGNGLRGFTERFTHDGRYILIGRVGALCGNVLATQGKFFASEHAIVVAASADTDISWLTFILEEMQLNQYSESSAQPVLTVSKLLKLKIARPPTKAEQAAIARILADMDAEIEALAAKLGKAHQIKQGMMQELLTGKIRLV